MTEIYRDFYGNGASIHTMKDGRAKLVVRNWDGKLFKSRIYTRREGAMAAMRRISDCWTRKQVI